MKTGFTFYYAGRDYFYPYADKTYRTKAIAENILTALGYAVNESTVEFIRKRLQHCTCEVKQNRNGNQVVLIHGNGFGIVDPEGKTVILN